MATIYGYIQTPAEQDDIWLAFLAKVDGGRGRKLTPNTIGEFLDEHNRANLKNWLEQNVVNAEGRADASLANLLRWVSENKAKLNWDVAPTGLTSRKPEKNLPTFRDPKELLDSQLEEKATQEQVAIWAECLRQAQQPQSNFRHKSRARSQELMALIFSFRKKPAAAAECLAAIRKRQAGWANEYE